MKISLKLLLAGVTGLALLISTEAAPAVGQVAPDFSLIDINGQQQSLASYKGKTVVLEWVNPQCPFVQKHYQESGNMPAMQQAALAEGVIWLTINSGRPGAQGDYDSTNVLAWQKKTGATPTAYLRDHSGKVGKLYDARHTPTLFIVNSAGVLVYAGGIDSINSTDADDIARATNYVQAALSDLKAGRPIAIAKTKAYGCGVKY